MRVELTAIWFLSSLLTFGEQEHTVVPPAEILAKASDPTLDRAISRSGQFRIYGSDNVTRANVALLAEATKDELLRLIEEKDLWEQKVPIHISLHGKPGDPMPFRTLTTRLNYSEVGFDLRLDLHLCRGIETERFKFAITSNLLIERSLREMPPAPLEHPLAVPPWLIEGLLEATSWRLGLSDRKLYAALFKRGGLFKFDDLFSINSMEFEEIDAATRAAFRISAGALVMALLEQPQGKEGFRSFLSETARFEGEMPTLLRKHFPELNLSATSLEKWWGLQLANKGGLNPLTEIFSVQQTNNALSEALKLHVQDPEGFPTPKELSAWAEISPLKEPERIAAVRPTQDALVRLSYRCFPSYRPILEEYQLILQAIASQETENMEQRLAALEQSRTTMLAKAERARDFLDWFEITRARETSGVFDDYMRLKERLKSNPQKRNDNLSTYLDRLNTIFCRGLPTHAPEAQDPLAFPTSIDLPLPE